MINITLIENFNYLKSNFDNKLKTTKLVIKFTNKKPPNLVAY